MSSEHFTFFSFIADILHVCLFLDAGDDVSLKNKTAKDEMEATTF